jgi:ABC-type sugar transport system ATPase subunit
MTKAGKVSLRKIFKRHGTFTALHGIDLDIEPGEFFALLGPSGSGKTTSLRILAGLDEPSEGEVFLDGSNITNSEPGDRDVAMVFQSYALYPHMNVYQNIAFPMRMVGMPKGEIDIAVRDAARKVHIEHLLERKPGQLSGGQQQRCALARAIVRKPRLFLLDEPLSNLDAKLRLETRGELKKLQRSLGVTTVYVTHDQEEAMTIADRMAVFMEGRIAQVGTPKFIFDRPQTAEVANFIGSPPMNLIPATYRDGKVRIGEYELQTSCRLPGERNVIAGIRPSSVWLGRTGIPARIDLIENLGDAFLFDLTLQGMTIRARTGIEMASREGELVSFSADPSSVHLFDAETRIRIDA